MNKVFVGIDPGGTSGSICVVIEREGKERKVEFFQFSDKVGFKCKETGRKKYKNSPKGLDEIRDFMIRIRNLVFLTKCEYKICLERVNSMPSKMKNSKGEVVDIKMGSTSAFKFGGNFHSIMMGLVSQFLEFELCTPSKWQRDMEMTKTYKLMTKTEHKNLRRGMIQELYPEVKLINDKIDSLILAEYARTKTK